MVNKKVTLSLDEDTYSAYKKFCENHAYMLSKKIEFLMRDELKEAKKQ